jgi:hypothetical protein
LPFCVTIAVTAGESARRLLRADLLDEVRVHLVPLLLGVGTRLFDGAGRVGSRREARHGNRDPPTLPCRQCLASTVHICPYAAVRLNPYVDITQRYAAIQEEQSRDRTLG